MSVPPPHGSLLVDTNPHARAGQNAGTFFHSPEATDIFGTRTIPIIFGTIAAVLACITVVLGIMQHHKMRSRDEERKVASTMAGSLPQVHDMQGQ
jgi:hypothetical protein